MISIRKLRKVLETHIRLKEWNEPSKYKGVSKRISIKRKKKMILEELPNGCVKAKRRNVIKIEIIE